MTDSSELLANPDEPTGWSLTRLAGALRERRLSSRELLELQLRRIDRHDGAVNAVVSLDREGALAAADAADRDAAAGRWHGPLHGIPITVKDAIETAGLRSTGGAEELHDHLPTADAPAVARLREAGAIVFGKSNTARWCADVQTDNPLFGRTGNPHDPGRTAGGSSGGAAAALAAGFTAAELGTDVGGSIRIPAHCCGVCGHKPSFGLVPQRGYLDRVGGAAAPVDLNVFGPLARDPRDLDLLLGLLAGPDREEGTAWRLALPDPPAAEAIGSLRIGVWLDDPAGPLDRSVASVLAAAVAALEAGGLRLLDARPPIELAAATEIFTGLVVAATALSRDDDRPEPHRAWLGLRERQAHLRERWRRWFEDFDALICPVMPVPAQPHDDAGFFERTVSLDGSPRPLLECFAWIGLATAAYLPATTIPAGLTAAALPVGIQVIGPLHRDRTTIAIAAAAAAVLGRAQVTPSSGSTAEGSPISS